MQWIKGPSKTFRGVAVKSQKLELQNFVAGKRKEGKTITKVINHLTAEIIPTLKPQTSNKFTPGNKVSITIVAFTRKWAQSPDVTKTDKGKK